MSTQQQIDQYNAALRQKQEERAAQQTILRVQQEELSKAENATVDAELALDRARKSGASAEQVESLQRQVRQAGQAESSARVAASQTEDNIGSLDGSIRYNTAQRDLYQRSLPAQGNPSSTVADRPANARSDAAQVAPAPQPAQPSPAPVTRTGSAIEEGGEAAARVEPRQSPPEDFVFDRDGSLLPSDSSAAAERRAEIAAEENRARAFDAVDRSGSTQADGNAGEAAARVEPRRSPPEDFVFEEDGTLIPSDSSRAEERRAEIEAEERRGRFDAPPPVAASAIEEGGEEGNLRLPPNVPPNTSAIWDPETGSYAVYDNDTGQVLRSGFPTQEQAQASAENRNLDLTGSTQDDGDAGEAIAQRNAEPVPPNVSVIQDENGTWGVWNDDEGRFIVEGLSQQEAQLQAEEIAAGFGVQERPFPPGALATGPEPVPDNYTAISDPEGTPPNNWAVWNDTKGVYESQGLTQQEAQLRAENLSLGVDEPFPQGTPGGTGLTEEEQRAKDEAAAKANAINQATRQSVYKQGGSSDWRVRLQLSPTSNYLYNQPAGQRGILDPLFNTNGVIFPYTPQIQTNYQAKYTDYDLVHSNFRGVFYQSSRVDDIQLRAEFTAQDTNEANYLLAVIHFFRSVTKMFYGKDTERGTPPPLVYLSGLGMDQFYGHPCLVRSFQYSLPNNVDYIRATNVNNYGTDLLSRRTASAPSSVAGLGATGNRLLNAGLARFGESKPAPTPVVAQVNNTQLANYVPTKMEIDIVLIPVQTRSQVSKQFSLKDFANGNLIRNGFW